MTGRSCPGMCGHYLEPGGLFACPRCTARLPARLHAAIAATWWAQDWPAHSRALTEAMHHLTYPSTVHRGGTSA